LSPTAARLEVTVALLRELSEWASKLELAEVPPRVTAFAKSQVLSQLAAARATLDHELGVKIVAAYGSPLTADPKRSAYVLAALTTALDYDDTVYAGHVSHSSVGVALAYSRALRLRGREVLVATIAANECAARITAAATLGPFRGQTAAHTHLAGATAARLRGERAPAERWVNAFGLAFAAPPWPLMHAFLGSEAKVLTAATPIRIALDACDGVAGGLVGAADVLEHPEGFLAKFADVPLPEAVTAGLGELWHSETVSFKVHPGSAYIQGCVDCAVALHNRLPTLAPQDVDEVLVRASLFTVGMDSRTRPYLRGPKTQAIPLTFSVAYSVATALLTGSFLPADLACAHVEDPARWALAAKLRVEHDHQLSRCAVRATAPLGQALRQAGPAALEWARAAGGAPAERFLDGIGPPLATFEDASNALGASVTLRLRDGRELSVTRNIPVGSAGPQTREHHREVARAKFLASGGSEEVADGIASLEDLAPAELRRLLDAALEPGDPPRARTRSGARRTPSAH
jgi:2-methylcitrate dehydratase PrpD